MSTTFYKVTWEMSPLIGCFCFVLFIKREGRRDIECYQSLQRKDYSEIIKIFA